MQNPVAAAARAPRTSGSALASLKAELAACTRELNEALEQEAAMSEVLGVISQSPGALEPVFQTILANATRICGAEVGVLFRYEDGAFTGVSKLGVPTAYAEYLDRGPIIAGPKTGLGRVVRSKQTVQVVDTLAEQVYREPLRVATAELLGARSLLNVPMLNKGELIGAIGRLPNGGATVYRQGSRAGHGFCRPGRNCHRECASAERAPLSDRRTE